MDKRLTVDIPGAAVFALKEPDENGYFYTTIAPNLYFEFLEDESEQIYEMILHQAVEMVRKDEENEQLDDIPEEFQPYIGKYYYVRANAIFELIVCDKSLAIFDNMRNDTVQLIPYNKDGKWIDEYNKNIIWFSKNSEGKITKMFLDSRGIFKRGVLAAKIVEQIIEEEGIDAGLNKFELLKKDGTSDYIFSERSFNNLGYKLLNNNKINEAIEIFKLNTIEYPDSWNVFGCLGEAYLKADNKKLAKKNFKKSLKLNPENENAKEKLEKIKSNKEE